MNALFAAALALLTLVACTNETDTRARHTARDSSSPNKLSSSAPGVVQLCEPQSRDLSYGETIPGRWLEDVIVSLGAPGGHSASKNEIRDTGTALWIDIPAYKESSTIYATMITPGSDPNITSSATKKEVGRRGSYILYFDEGNEWESYKASNGTWQLTLLAYAGPNKDEVTWPHEIDDWLNAALDRAEQSPPRCRGPNTYARGPRSNISDQPAPPSASSSSFDWERLGVLSGVGRLSYACKRRAGQTRMRHFTSYRLPAMSATEEIRYRTSEGDSRSDRMVQPGQSMRSDAVPNGGYVVWRVRQATKPQTIAVRLYIRFGKGYSCSTPLTKIVRKSDRH